MQSDTIAVEKWPNTGANGLFYPSVHTLGSSLYLCRIAVLQPVLEHAAERIVHHSVQGLKVTISERVNIFVSVLNMFFALLSK